MTVSKYKNNIGNATQLQVLRPLVLESQKTYFCNFMVVDLGYRPHDLKLTFFSM